MQDILAGLNAAGVDLQSPSVRRAVDWLVAMQGADGGWGEVAQTYDIGFRGDKRAAATPSQTAWAVLGLIAAGEVGHPAVARGVGWLLSKQGADGWN